MNLQESIRRILREETELPLYIIRRVNMEELDDLVLDVKELIDSDYDKTDAIYDTIRQFIATKKSFKFDYETERQYWDSYIDIEKPLVNYVKTNCPSAWSGRVWLDIEGSQVCIQYDVFTSHISKMITILVTFCVMFDSVLDWLDQL